MYPLIHIHLQHTHSTATYPLTHATPTHMLYTHSSTCNIYIPLQHTHSPTTYPFTHSNPACPQAHSPKTKEAKPDLSFEHTAETACVQQTKGQGQCCCPTPRCKHPHQQRDELGIVTPTSMAILFTERHHADTGQ